MQISELERKLSIGIIELNTTKASSDSVEQLSSELSGALEDISQLNTTKASKVEVDNLSKD